MGKEIRRCAHACVCVCGRACVVRSLWVCVHLCPAERVGTRAHTHKRTHGHTHTHTHTHTHLLYLTTAIHMTSTADTSPTRFIPSHDDRSNPVCVGGWVCVGGPFVIGERVNEMLFYSVAPLLDGYAISLGLDAPLLPFPTAYRSFTPLCCRLVHCPQTIPSMVPAPLVRFAESILLPKSQAKYGARVWASVFF